MGLLWVPALAPLPPGWVTLGSPFPLPASVSPVGTRRTLRAQVGSRGRPAEAGPGWERDRPLRRAGTSGARGGGAPGSSPGPRVAAPAAGGPAAAASAPAAARRRGRGRALRPPLPLRLQPRRGRRSPSRARAEPLPEPCPRPCPPPGGAAPRRKRQLSRSAGGASSAGKGEVPAPQSFWGTDGPYALGLRLGSCRLPVPRLPPRRPPPCAPFAPAAPGDPRPPPVLVSPSLWEARPRARSGPATVKSPTVSMCCLSF